MLKRRFERLYQFLTSRRLFYWHVALHIAALFHLWNSFNISARWNSSSGNIPLSTVQEYVAGTFANHLMLLQLLLLHLGILLLAQLWRRRRQSAARQGQFSTGEKLALALEEVRDLRAALNLADGETASLYEAGAALRQAQASERARANRQR